jgi:predicted DNA-binding transcriptional regulator AlpA
MELPGAKEVSDMTGVPVGTLRYWRHSDIGPASFTLGRRVVYRRDEVLRWISERRTQPGGEAATPHEVCQQERPRGLANLAVVKFRRCIIINGIDVGAVRPDLASASR